MGRAACSSSRIVRQDYDAGSAKQLGHILFRYVAAKLNSFVRAIGIADRFPIAGFRMMVRSSNDQPGIGHSSQDGGEGFHQGLQPFVSSPVADGQYALVRIASEREIRWARTGGKCAVGSDQNIVGSILRYKSAAIPG